MGENFLEFSTGCNTDSAADFEGGIELAIIARDPSYSDTFG